MDSTAVRAMCRTSASGSPPLPRTFISNSVGPRNPTAALAMISPAVRCNRRFGPGDIHTPTPKATSRAPYRKNNGSTSRSVGAPLAISSLMTREVKLW